MAKYEKNVTGNFNDILNKLNDAVMNGSMSASFEDGSEYHLQNFDFAVRVYERYSFMGGNRVSLTISLAGYNNHYFLSAITSGGSQAMLFKINTLGEEGFLDSIRDMIESL